MDTLVDNSRKLSLIVGLRNNLEYTKAFYSSVREIYQDIEIVFVSYGSQDGTHEWLDSLQDPFTIHYYSASFGTLSDTYNKGVSLATSKLVAFLHNDMILSEGFKEALVSAWKPQSVLFYTVIEPPIFEEDKHDWKIVENFGENLENFDLKGFRRYTELISLENTLKPFITEDPFFFLCVERKWLIDMGGLDSLFNPMFCEDSDLLVRFKLQNACMIQVPKAMVYHFVSKTSRFSSEYLDKSKMIEHNSIQNFYRKWCFSPSSTHLKRYDIAAVVRNVSLKQIGNIEPYVGTLYIDLDSRSYIESNQKHTRFNLEQRIKPISELANHGITVFFSMNKLKDKDLINIKNLSEIINDNFTRKRNFISRFFLKKDHFKIGRLKFVIHHLKSSENDLINREIEYI